MRWRPPRGRKVLPLPVPVEIREIVVNLLPSLPYNKRSHTATQPRSHHAIITASHQTHSGAEINGKHACSFEATHSDGGIVKGENGTGGAVLTRLSLWCFATFHEVQACEYETTMFDKLASVSRP